MSNKIIPVLSVLIVAVCVVGTCFVVIDHNNDLNPGGAGLPGDLTGYGDDSALVMGMTLGYTNTNSDVRYVNVNYAIDDVEVGELYGSYTTEDSAVRMLQLEFLDDYIGFYIGTDNVPEGVTITHNGTIHKVIGSHQTTVGNWTNTYTMNLKLVTTLPDLSASGNSLVSADGNFYVEGEHKLPGYPADQTKTINGSKYGEEPIDFVVATTVSENIVNDPTFSSVLSTIRTRLGMTSPLTMGDLTGFPGVSVVDTGETKTIQKVVCKKYTAKSGGSVDGVAYVYKDLVVEYSGIWYSSNTEFAVTMIPGEKEHTPVSDPAVEPTCTATGLTEGSHCSTCGAVLVEQKIVPAKGHTEVTVPRVEPTCDSTGLTAGKKCSVCEFVIVAQKVIPKIPSVEVTETDKTFSATIGEICHISANTIQNMVEKASSDSAYTLVIKSGDCSMTVDNAALKKLVSEDAKITLSKTTAPAGLPSDAVVYEICIGDTHDLGEGKITVTVPYDGPTDSMKVCCIVDGKATDKLDVTFEDGKAVFSVPHLSTYAILKEADIPAGNSDMTMYIVIGIIAVIAVIGLAVFFFKKKSA